MANDPILNILLPAASQADVYDVLGDAITALAAAGNAAITHDLSGGNVTVTADERRGYFLHFAEAQTAGDTVTFDDPAERILLVKNTGALTLNVVVGATSLTLAAGALGLYYLDGTANGLTELAEI